MVSEPFVEAVGVRHTAPVLVRVDRSPSVEVRLEYADWNVSRQFSFLVNEGFDLAGLSIRRGGRARLRIGRKGDADGVLGQHVHARDDHILTRLAFRSSGGGHALSIQVDCCAYTRLALDALHLVHVLGDRHDYGRVGGERLFIVTGLDADELAVPVALDPPQGQGVKDGGERDRER